AAGGVVTSDDGAYPLGLEHEDDGQADRAAADDDADLALGYVGATDGVPADGHRLGERGLFDRQAVGHGQREGLLDDEAFGVGAGGSRAQPERMHLLAAAKQR